MIQNTVGANVKVASSGASTSFVTYEGKVPLVFGFQVVKLIFDNGRYRTMKLVDAGGVSAQTTDSAAPLLLDADIMLMDTI